MLTIKIKTDNDAFHPVSVMPIESAKILRIIATNLERGMIWGVCVDSNGNKCGEWKLTRR